MTILLALLSCSDKDAPIDTVDTVDSVEEQLQGPCADQGWGFITSDPAAAVHVRTDGSDEGDGSSDAPVATLSKALEIAVLEERPIAVGPGSFEASLSFFGAPDGLILQGCSPQETTLTGEAELPVVDTNGAVDVTLAGFTAQGGLISIKVWADSTVDISHIAIDGATAAGISHNGGYGVYSDIQITGTVASEQGYGYGFAMDGGGAELFDLEVSDATMAGILVGGGEIQMLGVKVSGTQPDAEGLLGRGIQLQEYANGVFADVTLTNNADAGLYALRSAVTSTNLAISGTKAGVCEDCELQTGDAAVFSRGDSNVAPGTFQIALTDSVIDGADRTGFLFSGVTAEVTGTIAQDCGHLVDDKALLSQDGAVVSGDEVALLETPLGTNLNLLPQPE